MPAIFSSLHSFVSSAIRDFNNTSMSKPSPSACSANTLKLSRVLSPVLAWALSCTLGPSYLPESPAASDTGETPSLSSLAKILEGWSSLYCSDQHGLSPNRLVHHVFSYRGPSILLISMEGFSYCLAIDDEWIDGSKAFGSSHCLLIQTEPQYKAQPSEPGIILFNSHSRAATRGLIIGKGNPRIIHIDDLFDKATHFSIPVKLHAVEVWGCGGHDALKQQAAQKEWESREVDRAKNRKLKIDDWTDSPDRQLLELGGVCTEHAER
ncbi:hypothetical protein CAPTEDRAFT_222611 [Capitella teleta]|uniref:TLDc domain-containing protein n=1 Tax=Capitella teleta TaxID=283909 RepID=R7UKY0_CAPTE|nr:hypothetical protein CAPTEDRAFT_222611 [Capitella teleta]|eukprot:ELU04418.1 hypothetical protein CAPTEDRAFT_222611 [Capitella teleta]